jgi:hypothetical protein
MVTEERLSTYFLLHSYNQEEAEAQVQGGYPWIRWEELLLSFVVYYNMAGYQSFPVKMDGGTDDRPIEQ